MLALTHHLMVQFCAESVGLTRDHQWYDQYVVLGDDIVIFDDRVALRYVGLCKGLGVEINQNKSVISPSKPVVEFAKRTLLNGHDVSALSFKEMLQNNGFFGRLNLCTRLIRRSYGKDLFKIFYFVNKGNIGIFSDLKFPIVGYLSSMVFSKKAPAQPDKFKIDHLLSLITSKDYPFSYFGRSIGFLKPDLLLKVLKSFLAGTFKKDLISYTDRK